MHERGRASEIGVWGRAEVTGKGKGLGQSTLNTAEMLESKDNEN